MIEGKRDKNHDTKASNLTPQLQTNLHAQLTIYEYRKFKGRLT